MKKRLMIFCSLISLLLVGFQFPIYAEEDPSDTPSSFPVPNSIRLDQYFFDNYDLLPYIESDGQQIINTGIYASSNLVSDISLSDIVFNSSGASNIFGERSSSGNYSLFCSISNNYNRSVFNFDVNQYTVSVQDFLPYKIFNIKLSSSVFSVNNSSVNIESNEFETSSYLYIFGFTNAYPAAKFKLHKLSIMDSDTNNYVRYYYPARSKSGSVIGLYDAVSDTFVTTSGTVPFVSPIDDQVLNLQIGSFLSACLNWIGDILEFAVETPIIMIFLAIGLAGAMFRWGRRLVHF